MSAPTYEPPLRYWWDDHDNIVMTAWWMLERDHGARDFVYLIEKPWKFTTEYEQAQRDYEAERRVPEFAGPADDGAGHE
jgi:hypothetical protein